MTKITKLGKRFNKNIYLIELSRKCENVEYFWSRKYSKQYDVCQSVRFY